MASDFQLTLRIWTFWKVDISAAKACRRNWWSSWTRAPNLAENEVYGRAEVEVACFSLGINVILLGREQVTLVAPRGKWWRWEERGEERGGERGGEEERRGAEKRGERREERGERREERGGTVREEIKTTTATTTKQTNLSSAAAKNGLDPSNNSIKTAAAQARALRKIPLLYIWLHVIWRLFLVSCIHFFSPLHSPLLPPISSLILSSPTLQSSNLPSPPQLIYLPFSFSSLLLYLIPSLLYSSFLVQFCPHPHLHVQYMYKYLSSAMSASFPLVRYKANLNMSKVISHSLYKPCLWAGWWRETRRCRHCCLEWTTTNTQTFLFSLIPGKINAYCMTYIYIFSIIYWCIYILQMQLPQNTHWQEGTT